MATATPTKQAPRLIANMLYPDPSWSDDQRAAHAAARAVRDAMLDMNELFTQGVLRSNEHTYRAYQAWQELERAIAPLFAEKEES